MLVRFAPPRDLRLSDGSSSSFDVTTVEISSSATFVDVTSGPGAAREAEFPVLEARFPHDFFYPFVEARQSAAAAAVAASSDAVSTFSGGSGFFTLFAVIVSMFRASARITTK